MILNLNIELDVAEDVKPEDILSRIHSLIKSDDLYVGFFCGGAYSDTDGTVFDGGDVLGMINRMKIVQVKKKMKFKSIDFYETGIVVGELEIYDWVIECDGHTFDCQGNDNVIVVEFNKPTTIICPVCGQEGKVMLVIETGGENEN